MIGADGSAEYNRAAREFYPLAETIATLLDYGSAALAPALPSAVPSAFVPIRIRIDADTARSNLNGRLG